MKLVPELLTDQYSISFSESDLDQQLKFFNSVEQLASHDLSLAHSIFKTNAAKLIVVLAGQKANNSIGSFSVYKPFDTVTINNRELNGRKHWVSNLSQAEYGIYQVPHNNEILLCYVDTTSTSITKDFSYLCSPGLADTCTGDIVFNKTPTTVLFAKSDTRYFLSNNFNSLCFIANYLGAARGLLRELTYEDTAILRSTLKNLSTILDQEITSSSFVTVSSDSFWHTRNALYLGAKTLLVNLIQHIVMSHAGKFYNINSAAGKHFYDCLVYSGHNGAVTRNLSTIYTEPQDA